MKLEHLQGQGIPPDAAEAQSIAFIESRHREDADPPWPKLLNAAEV